MKDGKAHRGINFFGLERTNITGDTPSLPATHTISVRVYRPMRPRLGPGASPLLSVDGEKIAEGQIPKTEPFALSGDEGADVGIDGETNVSNDYQPGRRRVHREKSSR